MRGRDDVDMVTAMEVRMLGEFSRAATGMPRKVADEIVGKCLEQYEPTLGHPPGGKRFQELYDLSRLKPTADWLGMFETVKSQLKAWGVPLR